MNRNVGSTDLFTIVRLRPIVLGDQRPIINARASERIDAKRNLGIADRRHIDNGFEIVDVGVQVVVLMRRRGSQRLREQRSLDALERGPEKIVGLRFDPGGHVSNRPALRAEDRI